MATESLPLGTTAARLPLDRIARRIGKGATVIARQPDGSEIPVATPADLPRLTRTSAP